MTVITVIATLKSSITEGQMPVGIRIICYKLYRKVKFRWGKWKIYRHEMQHETSDSSGKT